MDKNMMTVYIEPRDWWVGYYRGDTHHYVCPLPCVVIRWRRGAAVPPEDPVRTASRRLVREQGRMLDRWAEGDDHVKRDLWRRLHAAGDRLRDVLEETDREASS
jgi:hypothetical protein